MIRVDGIVVLVTADPHCAKIFAPINVKMLLV
jgi:hypothetical protein